MGYMVGSVVHLKLHYIKYTRINKMTLQSQTQGPTLSPAEREKVKKYRSDEPNRRLWLIEKNGYRSIMTQENSKHLNSLKRKGWFCVEIPEDLISKIDTQSRLKQPDQRHLSELHTSLRLRVFPYDK